MQITDNFNRQEFACKCGCGFDAVDVELVEVLEDVRTHFKGNPVKISSGCRCVNHNVNVGGSRGSRHIHAIAVDFKVVNVHADKVAGYLENKYQSKYGVGRYVGRTHLDVRKLKARWDKR